jgi:hypothetical protein
MLDKLVAVPPGVIIEIVPVAEPAAGTAVIVVAFVTLNEAAATPLKLTAVAPVRLVPVMVTVAPAQTDVGLKLVIVGVRL